ncbi:catalyzes the cleavage of p-aminobenzoyl-glutamate to p-aminobenzoate and glutamate, subunit A [Porphyromonas crevioricanis JCM 15906]|uniref:Succinyl-diaminopimelate desuccinylase n=2 Tax=Porphyromonas crevioricanis TaxID=393921 RepID=A0A2X4PLP9_9PORP|nr:dipeptidase [Porphyromonas crevioricanis]GAD06311.1 catalyzes the cleavage of p-aminobenzoyl-glutamate to p-aminobenzoate and glutamate, subunit A [Porphyromonas crevioricanis JCM 15906]GAD06716.1 catalyzes the cleavage of p-aminobenzoyl-glutamate to p-aminobenzoate and glutamate, subunit A [Porphyromonas crevioricanis JCM 13913]SJZ55235.1 Acetylornithine deacetylase/Succinyl-diaminopimelate desuccinylase [Porphyromonas crevioricanis]SQH73315.1 Succinyl-diaminopimelate desuccinylase [Porphyr
MTTKEYIKQNEERFLNDLFELIRIPSISAKQEHKADMQRTAEHWRDHLLKIGATKAEVMPTIGNPVVYAERIIDPQAKTVLVYGHYDVMPVEPLELWKSEPFEPEIRDGHIWARGADDDKGQSMIQAKGFETALALGYVNCNVKFILEGEEEIGSGSLYPFLEQNKELLKADFILVSDTSMLAADIPSMTSGLRGLAYWEIEVTGPNRDLHSGIYGGAVGNPINELCNIISKIIDENGHITIPGFYDDVVPLSEEERRMIAQVPYNEKEYCDAIGVDAVTGEKGYVTLERNSCRPCFDVCGIWGGYTGEGAKTVLPSKAFAKVSCRLVANQDHEKVAKQLVDYIATLAPKHVKVEVRPHHGGQAYLCPIDMPAYRTASDAIEIAFGKRPLAVRSGGSIPIIAGFERILGLKSILMGFGLGSNAIHSPNENMPLDMWYKGIEAVAEFYRLFK